MEKFDDNLKHPMVPAGAGFTLARASEWDTRPLSPFSDQGTQKFRNFNSTSRIESSNFQNTSPLRGEIELGEAIACGSAIGEDQETRDSVRKGKFQEN